MDRWPSRDETRHALNIEGQNGHLRFGRVHPGHAVANGRQYFRGEPLIPIIGDILFTALDLWPLAITRSLGPGCKLSGGEPQESD